jgi:aerobic carbon-monoxide dehydrogenase large subunit
VLHSGLVPSTGSAEYSDTTGADGQNKSATLLDYAMPTAAQLPVVEIEHLERPDPGTPLGMKGMAEGGVMGASAAIANAAADALAPFGAEAGRQPFSARSIAEALPRSARH